MHFSLFLCAVFGIYYYSIVIKGPSYAQICIYIMDFRMACNAHCSLLIFECLAFVRGPLAEASPAEH